MKWWPFVTKKEYKGVIERYKLVIELEQERHIKELQRQREDIESRVDQLITEIFNYRLTYDPPFQTEISVTIDPDLVIALRDPSLGSDLRRDKITWLIANRLAHTVQNVLFLKGIVNTQGWK